MTEKNHNGDPIAAPQGPLSIAMASPSGREAPTTLERSDDLLPPEVLGRIAAETEAEAEAAAAEDAAVHGAAGTDELGIAELGIAESGESYLEPEPDPAPVAEEEL